jgi:hypothetical protein
MKKVMLMLSAVVLISTMLFSCTEENVKPSIDGTRTESNPHAWD